VVDEEPARVGDSPHSVARAAKELSGGQQCRWL